MPKIVKPEDRRVPVSIRQGLIAEAGACGCVDIESYVVFLKNTIEKQYTQVKELTEQLHKVISTTEKKK